MPVRTSRLMRVALKQIIDLQSRGALPGDHMQHLVKQYRKPWSEMQRQQRRREAAALGAKK